MSVTRDRGDAFYTEVKWRGGESGFFEEWHDEGTQAAVHMEPNRVFLGQLTQGNDVIGNAMREVHSRPSDL
jgi:hypothetical protein